MTLFPDLYLAQALEGAEAATTRAFGEAAAAVYPDKPIRVIACAGGVGLFYGPNDPLNAIKGVGLNGPVDAADWDTLESWFRAHHSPVVVDLCPLADDAFVALLAARGYRVTSFETVTAQRLDGPASASSEFSATVADPAIQLHRVNPADADAVAAWGRVLDVGFADGGEPMKFAVDFARVRAHLARSALPTSPTTSVMFLATVDGDPAGGAGLSIHHSSRVAHFAGAAVLPQFRRRGIQAALTRLRLRIARETGCTLAKFDVRAGSISHHNAVRAGSRSPTPGRR